MTEAPPASALTECQPVLRCLACDHAGLALALDLGAQTLANDYLPEASDAAIRYPLALTHCPACGHGQLSHFVSPQRLFGHYLYASGTSQTLLRYFDWFAQACRSVVPEGSRVLEIASNDGSLLQTLKAAGFDVLGIDPARNLAHAAQQRGLPTLCDFWPSDQIASDARFELVIGQNVLAHTPTPHAFLQAVQRHLSPTGLCLIQTSQAQMLDNGEFDTIYHEHHSFFTPRSMAVLAQRSGLALRAVHQVAIHGNSWLFVLSHPGALVATTGPWDTPPFGLGRCLPLSCWLCKGLRPMRRPWPNPMPNFARALWRASKRCKPISPSTRHKGRAFVLSARRPKRWCSCRPQASCPTPSWTKRR
jgi:SAM-dependent methyltransferase